MLFRLIYVSRAVRQIRSEDVDNILTVARARNAGLGITGLLLFADDNFIQVLEGDKEAVETVFASIERDSRHRGVTVLVREDAAHRDFPDWAMGFERVAGGLPEGVSDVFPIESSRFRRRLDECAREVKSFIYGFLEMTHR